MTKTQERIRNKKELNPFSLRDHLVPFFFNEFKSEELVKMPGMQTKAVKLYQKSSLCRMIGLVHSKYEEDTYKYEYKLQFTINYNKGVKKYNSILYKCYKESFCALNFSTTDNNFINGFFEDLFRMSYLYFITGYTENVTSEVLSEAIRSFSDRYELQDTGVDFDALRALWYRNRDQMKLSRFQNQMSNRVVNY